LKAFVKDTKFSMGGCRAILSSVEKFKILFEFYKKNNEILVLSH